MDIRTVTYPTPTRKGRKHLPGEGGGEVRGDDGGGNNSNALGAGTPRLSGCHSGGNGGSGAGGEGDANNITLKLWDFGGTEEFHAVHGLFFSG